MPLFDNASRFCLDKPSLSMRVCKFLALVVQRVDYQIRIPVNPRTAIPEESCRRTGATLGAAMPGPVNGGGNPDDLMRVGGRACATDETLGVLCDCRASAQPQKYAKHRRRVEVARIPTITAEPNEQRCEQLSEDSSLRPQRK